MKIRRYSRAVGKAPFKESRGQWFKCQAGYYPFLFHPEQRVWIDFKQSNGICSLTNLKSFYIIDKDTTNLGVLFNHFLFNVYAKSPAEVAFKSILKAILHATPLEPFSLENLQGFSFYVFWISLLFGMGHQ